MLNGNGITIVFSGILFAFFLIPAIVGLIYKSSLSSSKPALDDDENNSR